MTRLSTGGLKNKAPNLAWFEPQLRSLFASFSKDIYLWTGIVNERQGWVVPWLSHILGL